MGIQTYADDFAGLTAHGGAGPGWLLPDSDARRSSNFVRWGFQRGATKTGTPTSAAPIAEADFTRCAERGRPRLATFGRVISSPSSSVASSRRDSCSSTASSHPTCRRRPV